MKDWQKEPVVEVGILGAGELAFSLHGDYRLTAVDAAGEQGEVCLLGLSPSAGEAADGRQQVGDGRQQLADGRQRVAGGRQRVAGGRQVAIEADGLLRWRGGAYRSLLFTPVDAAKCTFELHNVTIGIGFHWQRREDQRFAGCLRLIPDGQGQVLAINLIPVEDYLLSVISSEMSAHASLELLRAHAVISRSWLLTQMGFRMGKRSPGQAGPTEEDGSANADGEAHPVVRTDGDDAADVAGLHRPVARSEAVGSADAGKGTPAASPVDTVAMSEPAKGADAVQEVVRWYDHQAHTLFHVCADDHCQRYQGLTRPITDTARQAVQSTRGLVLAYDGAICDARFSKCCGGALEEFSTCWADVDVPYLRRKRDWLSASAKGQAGLPDLTREPEAERWIRSSPPAFCHTSDPAILRQVLNDYDQETHDFYRWTVTYTRQELSALIRRKLGVDLGDLVDLVPLARGPSGRIYRLKLVGSRLSLIVGKELEIRRALSPSHLYSSAFVVEKLYDKAQHATSPPVAFRLLGAGWGHGVGLCQIGAAVMGAQGYTYRDILLHYYPGAQLASAYG